MVLIKSVSSVFLEHRLVMVVDVNTILAAITVSAVVQDLSKNSGNAVKRELNSFANVSFSFFRTLLCNH